MANLYNPLDKENLGLSIRDALLKQIPIVMPPDSFNGVGIYAIYYVGSFAPYERLAKLNRNDQFACPIYVGKAVPKGSRKGGLLKDPRGSTELSTRLRQHAESIKSASNLRIQDFFFRYLIVDDIWIPLGEAYMIETFQPVWNKIVEGFGIKTPGKRRSGQYTSLWDTIHPGRSFVKQLGLPPNPKSAEEMLRDVEEYLAMTDEERAKVPISTTGDEPDDE